MAFYENAFTMAILAIALIVTMHIVYNALENAGTLRSIANKPIFKALYSEEETIMEESPEEETIMEESPEEETIIEESPEEEIIMEESIEKIPEESLMEESDEEFGEEITGAIDETYAPAANLRQNNNITKKSGEDFFLEHMSGMETEELRGEEIQGEHVEEVMGMEGTDLLEEVMQNDSVAQENAKKFCDQMLCNKSVSRQQVKKELEEHSDFRAMTNQSASGEDMVDRINMMYLSGNTDISRNHKGQRIKDVYDNLTKGTDLYKRECVRVPELDQHQEQEKYDFNGEKKLNMNQSAWEYNNEKIINGGTITDALMAFDPNGGSLHQL